MKTLLTLLAILLLSSCIKEDVNTPPIILETRSATDIKLQVLVPFNGQVDTFQNKDIVIRIKEIGGQPSNGEYCIIIPWEEGFLFSFNPSDTTATNPNSVVNNPEFDVLYYPDGTMFLYNNTQLQANTEKRIAVHIKGLNPLKTTKFHAYLLVNSGGDSNIQNNVACMNITVLP